MPGIADEWLKARKKFLSLVLNDAQKEFDNVIQTVRPGRDRGGRGRGFWRVSAEISRAPVRQGA